MADFLPSEHRLTQKSETVFLFNPLDLLLLASPLTKTHLRSTIFQPGRWKKQTFMFTRQKKLSLLDNHCQITLIYFFVFTGGSRLNPVEWPGSGPIPLITIWPALHKPLFHSTVSAAPGRAGDFNDLTRQRRDFNGAMSHQRLLIFW